MNLAWKIVLQFAVGLVISGLVLFVPAGTLRYWDAWILLLVWYTPGFFFSIYFYKHDPEVIKRRMEGREKTRDQQMLVRAVFAILLVGSVICGLDFRFGWTREWSGGVPLWLNIISFVMALAGYLVTVWVIDVNRFAARTVRVEPEQRVVSTGPYQWVRHPMYSGMVVLILFTPLALGSFIALPVFTLVIPLLVMRLRKEEAVLRRELSGYAEYCATTHYRLVPYLW
jgi:protein-S-isoprenylcysteine O-methyltransferase Ste14